MTICNTPCFFGKLLNVSKKQKKYCLDGNARCTKGMLLGGEQEVASEQKNEYTKLIR